MVVRYTWNSSMQDWCWHWKLNAWILDSNYPKQLWKSCRAYKSILNWPIPSNNTKINKILCMLPTKVHTFHCKSWHQTHALELIFFLGNTISTTPNAILTHKRRFHSGVNLWLLEWIFLRFAREFQYCGTNSWLGTSPVYCSGACMSDLACNDRTKTYSTNIVSIWRWFLLTNSSF